MVLVCTGKCKSTLYTQVRVVCVGKWGTHRTQKYIPYTVLEEELFENFFKICCLNEYLIYQDTQKPFWNYSLKHNMFNTNQLMHT